MIASQQSVGRSGHVVIQLDDDHKKSTTPLYDFWWDKVANLDNDLANLGCHWCSDHWILLNEY